MHPKKNMKTSKHMVLFVQFSSIFGCTVVVRLKRGILHTESVNFDGEIGAKQTTSMCKHTQYELRISSFGRTDVHLRFH
jgi:hypothetical protein